jgi:RNA polymerase sigma factor (sigma-70 family)
MPDKTGQGFSDVAIYNGLLNNDETVIQYVFYDHFRTLLQHNATKTAGNKNVDFEDLIQELFLYISKNDWEKLRKYNPEMPFANWFSVVSYRFFKDYTASMIDSSKNVPIDDMDARNILFQRNNKADMIMTDITRAIYKVKPPRDAEILKALLLDEEEPLAVANRFGVTVANLYNIKRRALAKLIQNHLQEYVNQ